MGEYVARFGYSRGRKNRWRWSSWNMIRDLLPVSGHRRAARVLYMPGLEDLDRDCARRKGFSPQNMIGIENHRETARALRGRGLSIVEGDLLEVCKAWPSDWQVHVVHADTTWAFGIKAKQFLDLMCQAAPFRGAVLCLNVQRGRDRWCREWGRDFVSCYTDIGKHRAKQLLALRVFMELRRLYGDHRLACNRVAFANELKMAQWNVAARFLSYRSQGVTMDSLVMRLPGRFGDSDWRTADVDQSLVRSLRAIRAVETMRSRGTRRPQPIGSGWL